MKRTELLHSLLTALALLGASRLHAQITFVDAVEGPLGNTGITGQPLSDLSWVGPDSTDTNDTQWNKRTAGGNGGTIFQALPADPPGTPELTTTIPDLADGTYNVWVFFQDNVGDTVAPYQNWVISAGLVSGSLTTYWGPWQPAAHNSNPPNLGVDVTTDHVSNAANLSFTTSVIVEESSGEGLRNLFGVNLGQVTVSGGSDIQVYVDMYLSGDGSRRRVWYDGVGYERVPPISSPITYVDAVEGASGNTYATGGSLGDTSWENGLNDGAVDENQWVKRTTVEGNDSTLFQAFHETVIADEMPELTTEITGLADGTYAIWAFYWDQVTDNSQNWTISAGLNSGALVSYSSPGEPGVIGAAVNHVVNAADLSFTNSVQVEGGFDGSIFVRNLFGVYLGQVTVSGGSSTVNVHVDNLIGNLSFNRTWYDGVGYSLLPAVAPSLPAITSFTAVGGGVWEVALKGAAGGIYEFRSSTVLDFTPGTLVGNLVLAGPGTISGTNDSVVTTDSNGNATVRMNLGSASKNFVRAQTAP